MPACILEKTHEEMSTHRQSHMRPEQKSGLSTYGGVGLIAVLPGLFIIHGGVSERLLFLHNVTHVLVRFTARLSLKNSLCLIHTKIKSLSLYINSLLRRRVIAVPCCGADISSADLRPCHISQTGCRCRPVVTSSSRTHPRR